MMPRSEVTVAEPKQEDADLLKSRGGRIDPLRVQEGSFDADMRVDQAIAESFPASDPPSWNSGLDEAEKEIRTTDFKVGYLIGSLARNSINRRLATALVRLAPKELRMTEIPIAALPLYSYDYDADFPEAATVFKQAIAGVDAVLFITPEYNRSIPGALKNAIDWASRPYGQNSFTRKPSAVIGASPGRIGTAVAQQHLRSILGYCNSPQMNSMEAYIQFEQGLVDDDGQVTNEKTREFLRKYMTEFHNFIARVYVVLPRNG